MARHDLTYSSKVKDCPKCEKINEQWPMFFEEFGNFADCIKAFADCGPTHITLWCDDECRTFWTTVQTDSPNSMDTLIDNCWLLAHQTAGNEYTINLQELLDTSVKKFLETVTEEKQ